MARPGLITTGAIVVALAGCALPHRPSARGPVANPTPASAPRQPTTTDNPGNPGALIGAGPQPEADTVAANFAVAYLARRFGDSPAELRLRCRPFDTDGLDDALAQPQARAPDAVILAPGEVDRVTVTGLVAEDTTADAIGYTLTANVDGGTMTSRPVGLELRLVRNPTSGGWQVSQVTE
jgi:hypothetical protein